MNHAADFWIALPVGLAAMAEDLWHRRISNWTALVALVAGTGWNVVLAGWSGLGTAMLGAGCGFSVFLIFYLLGGMGGGDVKLMAGFGALLGAGRTLEAALWVAGIGGLLAVLVLCFRAFRRQLRRRPSGQLENGRPVPAEKSGESIPYAPAIALGVWITLLARSL